MYSFCRSVASEIALRYGNDAARQVLGHQAGTTPLEAHYLRFAHRMALVSTSIDEVEEDELQVLQERSNHGAIERLSVEDVARPHGPALQALLQESLASDSVYLTMGDAEPKARYRQRLRYRLANEARKLLIESTRATITIADFDKRRQALTDQAHHFEEGLKRYISSSASRREITENSREPTLGNDAFSPIVIDSDDEDDTTIDDLNYGHLASGYMQQLLDNNAPSIDLTKLVEKQTCPACERDETMPAENKVKEWSVGNLAQHLQDASHTPIEKYRRAAILAAGGAKHQLFCHLCRETVTELQIDLSDGPLKSYRRWADLRDHIRKSTATKIQGQGTWKEDPECVDLHEALKEAEGWYEEGFEGDVAVRTRRQQDDRMRLARQIGWDVDTRIKTLPNQWFIETEQAWSMVGACGNGTSSPPSEPLTALKYCRKPPFHQVYRPIRRYETSDWSLPVRTLVINEQQMHSSMC